ncbi:MAG: protein kinase [Treponema sp.]|jgi:serine/threonine-protein kinase|nr:protein kinase [Treponema sp.]
MPAKVTITITKGENEGKSWEFSGEARIFIGRADDCTIKLRDHTVSRYHCMMEVNPPKLSFYDFGSLNGTYLNGKIVAAGRSVTGLSLEDAQKEKHVIFDLKDGDRIGLSLNCELGIAVHDPEEAFRLTVQAPHPGSEQTAPQNDPHEGIRPAANESGPEGREKCLFCGTPLDGPSGGAARICPKCRENPMDILMGMLKQAGGRDIEDIRGYRKIRQLGRGGMGEVWLVEEEETGRQAALKVMLPDMAVDERCRKGFLREASLGQQLRHENIITQIKYGNSGDAFFLLQEACLGGSVDGLMEKMDRKRLPRDLAIDIAVQMLKGLDYAHNAVVETKLSGGKTEQFRGVVHRDIKPQNVFIANEIPLEKLFAADGRGGFEAGSFRSGVYRSDAGVRAKVKVADFGLAKAFEAAGNTSMTGKNEVKGSIGFMCRQQLIDVRFSKPEVDVWAAAASLYYMLTGAFPKNIRSQRSMFQDVLRGDPVPIRERDPSLDKELAALIDEALIDRPEIKIKTAAELRAALESLL